MARKPFIQFEDVEVTYNPGKSNEFRALKGVKGEISSGEYIILFGPSGCGKSTLLYALLGVLPPTGGRVIVDGEDVYAYSSDEMVQYQRKKIGIIYQSFNLINSISVLDNVSLPQIFAGVEEKTRNERAMELLTRFGVGHIAGKLPMTLSGGQMQRVAVSRSLINDPRILLGDEPVGNLDTVSSKQVMDTLEEINMYDQKTVVLVTHDAKHLPYAHRVYYLNDGQIVRDVPNPEKKQIKKTDTHTIVTEIEMLAKMYPYASIEELRVRSAVNYLTQDMNFRELKVLEEAVEAVIDGDMGKEKFFRILNAPIEKGGVGIHRGKAEQMTEELMRLMEYSRDITRYQRKLQDDAAFFHLQKYIDRLSEYLLERYNGRPSKKQRQLLDEAVADRLGGVLRDHDFEKRLATPISKGGVGFNSRTALNLSTYLEKLIAQGVEYAKGGEEYISGETKQT